MPQLSRSRNLAISSNALNEEESVNYILELLILTNRNSICIEHAGIAGTKTTHQRLQGGERIGCDVTASWPCRDRAINSLLLQQRIGRCCVKCSMT